MLVGLEHSFIRYDYDWNLFLADWSAGSRLQTDLLTLDSRSGEPKIDNGLPARRACGTDSRDAVVRRRTHALEYKQPKGLVGILRCSGESTGFSDQRGRTGSDQRKALI